MWSQLIVGLWSDLRPGLHRDDDPCEGKRETKTPSQIEPAECTEVLLDFVQSDLRMRYKSFGVSEDG